MDKEQKTTKKMLSHESIYKIMQWLPPVVAALFFVKNLSGGDATALLTIGVSLALFVGMSVFVKVRKVSLYGKELTLAIALPILVFVISLNSGASYSDDFPMLLAIIGLTGLYLEPQFTKIQIIMADILFVIMYMVHPEKAGERSQYILCVAVFTLAAILFYMVIKRGRAFIEISEERAKESEKLLESIRTMGAELQTDFADSATKIEASTAGLKAGSANIARGAEDVSLSCNAVHEKIRETESQISQLDEGIKLFEETLNENKANVEDMSRDVSIASDIISESGNAFRTMEEQMKEITGIAKQISSISFKLTILSLNASVEAARAGEAGSGFEVLASEMRELSESCGAFSVQVADVVKELSGRVEETSDNMLGSEEALKMSEKTVVHLVDSFERLNQQFRVLYENIEQQNANVSQIDYIFEILNQRVSDMQDSSLENESAVEEIAEAMNVFKGNVTKIVENTQKI